MIKPVQMFCALAVAANTALAQGAITDKPLSDAQCSAAVQQAVRLGSAGLASWTPTDMAQLEARLAGRQDAPPLTEAQMSRVRPLMDSVSAVRTVWRNTSDTLTEAELRQSSSVWSIIGPRTANKKDCLARAERMLTR